MGDTLKRCPFCGSIAILDEIKAVAWRGGQSKPITKYIAQCIIPSCPGHHGKSYVNEQKAIDKWNMRVDGVDPEIMAENIRNMLVDAGLLSDYDE